MKIRRAAGLGAAAVVMLGFAAAASAQRGPGGFGGFGGQEARSNPLGLLMRTDVQSHLHLSLKQKQAIEEILNGAQQRQREQMQQLFQGRPQGNQQGLSREERRQQQQQFFQQNAEQMRAARQQFEGQLSEEIKKILKPEQLTRLYQLDYQYRGPLALADQQVAQAAQISQQTQQEIQKVVNDYRQQSGEIRREFFEGFRPQPGQPGQQGQRQRFNPEEMQQRMAPLQQKLEKLKKETEDKILALLTPQEKANWQALQGAPFTFRKDIQTGNPFFQGRGGFGRGQGGPGGQGRPGGGFRPGNRPY